MAVSNSTGELNIAKEVAAMKRMTVNELREKYADVFGESTPGRHKVWLIKRIAWRMQANAEGDLSERARCRAAELADDAYLRMTPPRKAIEVTSAKKSPGDERVPVPGSTLTREYKGQMYTVTVLQKGFDFDGERFKSLSAIAKAITGTHWNGYHFFGLRKKGSAK